MNRTHRALREGTSDAHERVDALYSRFDLAARESYADFLAAHAQALLPIEAALDADAGAIIDDWPSRRRGALLLADLAELGRSPVPAPPAPACGEAGAAGLLYLLEGSRHGARMLARGVPAEYPSRYLSADQPADSWRKLLDRLEMALRPAQRLQIAIGAARDGFAAFERSASHWLKG